ncbi:MAG: SMP-30/gluconolactonase/LRE family protein [Pseudomonadota bacterium]
MQVEIFDDTPCELGEGPLWHPRQGQLFWFDILNNRLHSSDGETRLTRQFNQNVSAAGWTGEESLLIASESGLAEIDLPSGSQQEICPLEEDNPETRSNDGRADPMGGFWIGTMGKKAEKHAGSIYRYYRGELRRLYRKVTIPNGICFAPDGSRAYFTDTLMQRILVQDLDGAGWPKGTPQVFVDLRADRMNPDGAVTDRDGNLWSAHWGASAVFCFDLDGKVIHKVTLPARHTSCPAFGGAELSDLFVTTAREHLDDAAIEKEPQNGLTFVVRDLGAVGWPEPQVML